MGQLGFFDLIRRYESLDEKSDPLVAIAAMLPFESFRSKLKAALIKGELRTSDATRKSLAGRKPRDYTKTLWSEPMRPIAQPDGHDFPGHVDKCVPCVTAVIEDIVVGFEYPVR